MLLRDRDSKYTGAFDDPLTSAGIAVKKVGFRSPNQNAYVERFVQAIEQECLDISSCSGFASRAAGRGATAFLSSARRMTDVSGWDL